VSKNISDIANIITGHIFRSKIEYSGNGNVSLLGMESVSSEGVLDLLRSNELFKPVIVPDIKAGEILLENDIIIKAKGLTNNAVVLKNVPDNITVTGSNLIVRVKCKNLSPEYVCCWLNSDYAKKHFAQNSSQATGITIANVSKRTLQNLPIKIPSLEIQKKIVALSDFGRQEINLLKKIIGKKEFLNKALLTMELSKIQEG
jgi:restriction endonuclease S subunit